MVIEKTIPAIEIHSKQSRHPLCAGYRNEWTGEFDCEYNTKLLCDDCKFGVGRKDPNAKCNQLD